MAKEKRGGREALKERGKSMWVMPSYLQKCTVKGAVRSGGVEMQGRTCSHFHCPYFFIIQ